MERKRKYEDRKKWGKRVMAAVLTLGALAVAGRTARAQEAVPFVDISADLISLSPQAEEMTMHVAARNMGEGTVLEYSVADGRICSVEWAADAQEYTELCYKRGEMPGETLVTVFVKDHPEIARQIRVTNRDVADSYVYEGDGNMLISGLCLPPVPYEVHVSSADADGYFGLLYCNPAGDMELLMNRVGAFEGSAAIPWGEAGASLQILAGGHWKIALTPVLAASAPTQTGVGNLVSGQFAGDGKAHSVYCANWAEKGNFIVWLWDINDHSKRLLANGAGSCGRRNEDVFLDASHSYYLSVESRGTWLVEFSG